MKTAISFLIVNIPSLAFLGASLWCLHHDHIGFAVTNLVFAVFTFASIKSGGKSEGGAK